MWLHSYINNEIYVIRQSGDLPLVIFCLFCLPLRRINVFVFCCLVRDCRSTASTDLLQKYRR